MLIWWLSYSIIKCLQSKQKVSWIYIYFPVSPFFNYLRIWCNFCKVSGCQLTFLSNVGVLNTYSVVQDQNGIHFSNILLPLISFFISSNHKDLFSQEYIFSPYSRLAPKMRHILILFTFNIFLFYLECVGVEELPNHELLKLFAQKANLVEQWRTVINSPKELDWFWLAYIRKRGKAGLLSILLLFLYLVSLVRFRSN